MGATAALEVLVGDGFSAVGPLDNRFHVVSVACKRVMQLRDGSRPRLPLRGHKHCVQAVAEVRAGVVPFLGPDAP
jgi:DNA-directed RNA polymerase subunit K/omega